MNNTVMKNTTTATAVTSNGSPAPAGLSTGQNSAQLQATLPGGSPTFSNPLLFNNIFWDNRAGAKGINTVVGIGDGDANPWDLGSLDMSILLSPTNSIVQQNAGTYPYTTSPTNSGSDPTVIETHTIPLTFTSWRTNINFIGAIMVTADFSPNLLGNYHLLNTSSPARNTAAASKTTIAAPAFDIDNQGRPGGGGFDMGADEVDGTAIGGGGGGGGGGGSPALPTLAVLDNFNRANANTLNNGSNWSQIIFSGQSSIRVNANQASAALTGWAMWNSPVAGFGAQQGAAFTFANTTLNTSALLLKASGGSASTPQNYIRVQYLTSSGGQVVVGRTTNTGGSFTTLGTFPATFVNGDTLTAMANADGSVDVWKTTAANVTTYLGHSATSASTGTGRIGILLPTNARVDDFKGGTLP
jgi:hypothetical protein